MCIVAAGDAKLHHPPSPLKGCDSALASLSSLRMSDGQQSQYSSALRLAAVSLLSCNHASMLVCKEAYPFGFLKPLHIYFDLVCLSCAETFTILHSSVQ